MNRFSNILELTEQVKTMKTSTTHFIEDISGQELKVKVLCQECMNDRILKRCVILYQLPYAPIIYSESYLRLCSLTNIERELLLSKQVPIGKIFAKQSNDPNILKKNIIVGVARHLKLNSLLKIQSEEVFKKSYEYWANSEMIGTIHEFFSLESLERLVN